MAFTSFNNNAVYSVLKDAYKQITGKTAIDELDLSSFVEKGAAFEDMVSASTDQFKEQFTKALLNATVKNFYLDTAYKADNADIFYEDSQKFGAICQMISAELPDSAIQESLAWKEWSSGDTVGTYTIVLPSVSDTIFGKSVSWQCQVTITGNQWNSAFKNENELSTFVSYIMLVVGNTIEQHREAQGEANRNNFIAEKISYAGSQDATGVHKINLVSAYQAETGDTTISTAEGFMADDKCMRYAAELIDKYVGYLQQRTELFNTEGKKKHVPKDRLICQILQHFDSRMKTVSYGDAYQLEYIKLDKNYQTIPYWQGFGVANSTSGLIDFDEVSKIEVKTSSGDSVEQSGIVALLVDKWAIMHTTFEQRVATKHFDPENLDLYFYQFRDRYINNLQQNGIVFTVEDVE